MKRRQVREGRGLGRLPWVAALGRMAAAVALVVPAALAAADPATAADAGQVKLTQDGWWNRLQGAQEGTPPAAVVPPSMPSTVATNAIVASLSGGQPDKLAAVGLSVAVPNDLLVSSLVLRLAEAPGRSGGTGGEQVVACPAIGPWGPAKNASWRDRPETDCSFGRAEGRRGADGTWSFDLTTLARKWVATSAPLPQLGVVLMIEAGAASGLPGVSPRTEVSWFDIDSGRASVTLSVVPRPSRPPAGIPDGSGTMAGGAGTAVLPAEAPATPPSTSRAKAAPKPVKTGVPTRPPSDRPAVVPTETVPDVSSPADPGEPESPAAPADDEQAVADRPTAVLPAARPVGAARPGTDSIGFWDGLPGSTPFLAVGALAATALLALVLSPAGRPLPAWVRSGGLSRALVRRQSVSPPPDHADADDEIS